MIDIRPAAAEQIKAVLRSQRETGLVLRVAARRGDDGAIEYGMGFDERRDQDEEVVTEAGITLLVSPPSLEAIAGTVIDYVEIAPGDLRFVFYRADEMPAEQPSEQRSELRSDQPPGAQGGGCSCGKGGCSQG
jgi:iron-sulfur cluster assembly protein